MAQLGPNFWVKDPEKQGTNDTELGKKYSSHKLLGP